MVRRRYVQLGIKHIFLLIGAGRSLCPDNGALRKSETTTTGVDYKVRTMQRCNHAGGCQCQYSCRPYSRKKKACGTSSSIVEVYLSFEVKIYHTYVTYSVSVQESDPTCDRRQFSFTSQYATRCAFFLNLPRCSPGLLRSLLTFEVNLPRKLLRG